MTVNEITLQHQAETLVQREVIVCLSSMVATLATGYGMESTGPGAGARIDLSNLAEQAFELCSPRLDHEEAARQAGWRQCTGSTDWYRLATDDDDTRDVQELATGTRHVFEPSAEDACNGDGLDPYEWEVFEHWAVSTWLAEKLSEAGERVDTDFAGLNVWGRTTTGQSISMDAVIQTITRELHTSKPEA